MQAIWLHYRGIHLAVLARSFGAGRSEPRCECRLYSYSKKGLFGHCRDFPRRGFLRRFRQIVPRTLIAARPYPQSLIGRFLTDEGFLLFASTSQWARKTVISNNATPDELPQFIEEVESGGKEDSACQVSFLTLFHRNTLGPEHGSHMLRGFNGYLILLKIEIASKLGSTDR